MSRVLVLGQPRSVLADAVLALARDAGHEIVLVGTHDAPDLAALLPRDPPPPLHLFAPPLTRSQRRHAAAEARRRARSSP